MKVTTAKYGTIMMMIVWCLKMFSKESEELWIQRNSIGLYKPKYNNLFCIVSPRVFSDRLINQTDVQAFVELLAEKLGVLFDQTYHNICPNKVPPLFGECYSHVISITDGIIDSWTTNNHIDGSLLEVNISTSPTFEKMGKQNFYTL